MMQSKSRVDIVVTGNGKCSGCGRVYGIDDIVPKPLTGKISDVEWYQIVEKLESHLKALNPLRGILWGLSGLTIISLLVAVFITIAKSPQSNGALMPVAAEAPPQLPNPDPEPRDEQHNSQRLHRTLDETDEWTTTQQQQQQDDISSLIKTFVVPACLSVILFLFILCQSIFTNRQFKSLNKECEQLTLSSSSLSSSSSSRKIDNEKEDNPTTVTSGTANLIFRLREEDTTEAPSDNHFSKSSRSRPYADKGCRFYHGYRTYNSIFVEIHIPKGHDPEKGQELQTKTNPPVSICSRDTATTVLTQESFSICSTESKCLPSSGNAR